MSGTPQPDDPTPTSAMDRSLRRHRSVAFSSLGSASVLGRSTITGAGASFSRRGTLSDAAAIRAHERARMWSSIVAAVGFARAGYRVALFGSGRRFFRPSELENTSWRAFALMWRVSFSLMRCIERRRRMIRRVRDVLPAMADSRRRLDSMGVSASSMRGGGGIAAMGTSLGTVLTSKLRAFERQWAAARRLLCAAVAARRGRIARIMFQINAVEDALRDASRTGRSVSPSNAGGTTRDLRHDIQVGRRLRHAFVTTPSRQYTLDRTTGEVSASDALLDPQAFSGASGPGGGDNEATRARLLTYAEPQAVADAARVVVGAGDSVAEARSRLGVVPLLFPTKRAVVVEAVRALEDARYRSWLTRRAAVTRRKERARQIRAAHVVRQSDRFVTEIRTRKAGLAPNTGDGGSAPSGEELPLPVVGHGPLFLPIDDVTALVAKAAAAQRESLEAQLFRIPRAYAKIGAAAPEEATQCRIAQATLRRMMADSHTDEAAMLALVGVPECQWRRDRLALRHPTQEAALLRPLLCAQDPANACDGGVQQRGAFRGPERRFALFLDAAIASGAVAAAKQLWLGALRVRLTRQLRGSVAVEVPKEPSRESPSPSDRTGSGRSKKKRKDSCSLATSATSTAAVAASWAAAGALTWLERKPVCMERRIRGRTPPKERFAAFKTYPELCRSDPYFVRGVDDRDPAAAHRAEEGTPKVHRSRLEMIQEQGDEAMAKIPPRRASSAALAQRRRSSAVPPGMAGSVRRKSSAPTAAELRRKSVVQRSPVK